MEATTATKTQVLEFLAASLNNGLWFTQKQVAQSMGIAQDAAETFLHDLHATKKVQYRFCERTGKPLYRINR